MRMTEQEIIELLQAYKPGDVVEWSSANYTLTKEEWEECRGGPKWDFFNHRYRLKELTPDQRKLKEAEANIKELEQEIAQLKERVAELKKSEDWIPWEAAATNKGPTGLDHKFVEVRLYDGRILPYTLADYFDWSDCGDCTIVAYRVVKEGA